MTHQPILSICIPTYNRESYLKKLLETIVSQECFSNKIEIFIYDDPSSDDTESMVWVFMEKYPNIRYHRNVIRAGMMPSILDAILHCSWKYIWLFGSDDIMGPFWLESMLRILNEQEPDLVLSNYAYLKDGINHEKEEIKYQTFDDVSSFCNSLTDEDTTLSETQYRYHHISYFSYMSIFCFKNSVFKDSYDILLQTYWKKYLESHYFNYIFILFWWNLIHRVCLCENPVLTYNQSWEVSWRMSTKIIRDTFSVLRIINKYNKLQRSSRVIFMKIGFTWCRWFLESEIYHSSITRFIRERYSPLYNKLVDFYRLIRNK